MSQRVVNEVRKGFYLDSVALMRISRSIAALEGIEEAAVMMGTPANRELLADAGLLAEAGQAAGAGDLVIGIRASSAEAAAAALAEAEAQLDRPSTGGGRAEAWRPKTLGAALRNAPEANLALISVPGEFAVAEARRAIRAGLHAMIFSDNVPVADEATLKTEALALGRLVMGPDCGTAIIGGTPLAFANVVPRGAIGIIGASGTGTQEISCLIAQHGSGVSHAIGVGGRDLHTQVGGLSTLMALDALAADKGTAHIVLVSKPPPEAVAAKVLERLGTCGKPATVCFLGAQPMPMPNNAVQVFTLKAAALAALGRPADAPVVAPDLRPPPGRSSVQGLYAGGTLCAEAQVIFRDAGVKVQSNAPVPGVATVGAGTEATHTLLDLGSDEYTRGRPHPMIDPEVRDAPVIAALQRPDVGVLLLDVVLGHGAHMDPAGHLGRLLEAHRPADGPVVIGTVTGTEADPQVRSTQVARLERAGVHVAPANADAAAWALAAIQRGA